MGSDKKELRNLALAIAITFIAFFAIFRISGKNVFSILRAKSEFVIIALLLHSLFWTFWALRLRFIAKIIDGDLEYKNAFTITLASNFFAAITPSSAGGEPIRVIYLSKNGINAGKATAIVLIERLVDSVFFVTFLVVLLVITDFALGLGFKVGGVFLIALFIFILLLYELFKYPERIKRLLGVLRKRLSERVYLKIEREVWNFREALVDLLMGSKKHILALFILTAFIWIPEFLVPSYILMAFDLQPHFLLSLTSQAIIVVISLIPLTPGSSGIAEGSFFYLYSQFIRGDLAPVVAVWRTITYITNIISGFLANLSLSRKFR